MKLDELMGRRSELMAELFLQDLGPRFVAKAPDNLGFDFIVGFTNRRGGVNVVAVEVKTRQTTLARQQMKAKSYDLLANSNVPGLLLVIDVKSNTVLYHLARPGRTASSALNIYLPLIEVDEAQRSELTRLFSSDEGAPCQAVQAAEPGTTVQKQNSPDELAGGTNGPGSE
ncbi:MAG: hypothetical protein KGS28_16930 [Betaproteobacteria bacterium]|nr:hypothetical protein [Betaproteobacteria bacterium]